MPDPVASPLPWYRQAWPWLLMLMPALAVVGGVLTFWLAATTNNAVVIDDYYRDGKAINIDLARDRVAAQRQLRAALSRDAAGAALLRLSGTGGALPPFVILRVVHATRAELDQTITLSAIRPGEYTAPAGVSLPGDGRWNLTIEDPERSWRLTTRTDGFSRTVDFTTTP